MIFAKLEEHEQAMADPNSVNRVTKGEFYPSFSCISDAMLTTSAVRIKDIDRAPDPAEGLNPKVVEVYTKYAPLVCSIGEKS